MLTKHLNKAALLSSALGRYKMDWFMANIKQNLTEFSNLNSNPEFSSLPKVGFASWTVAAEAPLMPAGQPVILPLKGPLLYSS